MFSSPSLDCQHPAGLLRWGYLKRVRSWGGSDPARPNTNPRQRNSGVRKWTSGLPNLTFNNLQTGKSFHKFIFFNHSSFPPVVQEWIPSNSKKTHQLQKLRKRNHFKHRWRKAEKSHKNTKVIFFGSMFQAIKMIEYLVSHSLKSSNE